MDRAVLPLCVRSRAAVRLYACLALLVVLASTLLLGMERRSAVTRADALTTPVGGRLAYLSAGNVWLAGPAGARQVTSSGDAQGLRWSPAGGYLIVSRRAGALVLRADGTPSAAHDGAWTPDDSLVEVSNSQGGIDLEDPRDGSVSSLLPAQQGIRLAPVAWSADGSQLLLNRDELDAKGMPQAEEVWAAGRDGSGLRRLAAAGATWPRALGWSPDGRWIALWQGPNEPCVSCRADGQELVLISADGTRTIDVGPLLRPEWLAWSPDGATLAAVIGAGRETYRDKHLVLIVTATGQITRLPESGAVQIQPAWSADGTWLAYTAGPALPGGAFTNLDAQHGYPDTVLGRRSVRVYQPATGQDRALDAPAASASEAPVWEGSAAVLVVRWRSSGSEGVPQAQLWQVGADGTASMVAGDLSGAAPAVDYYGAFGWSRLVAWHP